jgi:hypothetical protein
MMERRRRNNAGCVVLVAAVLTAVAAPAGFAAPTAGIGADFFSGPEGVTTKDLLGYVAGVVGGEDVAFSAARYSHSQLGSGTSISGTVNVLVAPMALIQATSARTSGDESYRSWRIQTGPMFGLGGGTTLGLFYARVNDNLGLQSDGAVSECNTPISASVLGTARISWASLKGGGTSFQGAAGVTWSPASRVQLLAELGLGRDVVALPQGGSLGQGSIGISAPAPDGLGRLVRRERQFACGCGAVFDGPRRRP